MNTLSIVLSIVFPLSVILYVYLDSRSFKKKGPYRKSLTAIEPFLTQTESNSGERKYEKEYVENGKSILDNGSFLNLIKESSIITPERE